MGRGTLGCLVRAECQEAQSPRCGVASGGSGPGGSPDSSPRVSPTLWWCLGVLCTGVSSAGRQAVPSVLGVSGFWVSCFKVFRDTWRAGWWMGARHQPVLGLGSIPRPRTPEPSHPPAWGEVLPQEKWGAERREAWSPAHSLQTQVSWAGCAMPFAYPGGLFCLLHIFFLSAWMRLDC